MRRCRVRARYEGARLNLINKQKLFSPLVARLILKAGELGYEVTLGEAWRPPETAALYQQDGRGVSNSLHCIRLAIDLNLFKDGKWLNRTEDYRELGEWWEGQHELARWGGRFAKGDGGHFSLENNGVR